MSESKDETPRIELGGKCPECGGTVDFEQGKGYVCQSCDKVMPIKQAYTDDIKRQALAAYATDGAVAACKKFNIPYGTLYAWQKRAEARAKAKPVTNGKPPTDREQRESIKKELQIFDPVLKTGNKITRATKPTDMLLILPPFSEKWASEVQIKWLDVFQKLALALAIHSQEDNDA